MRILSLESSTTSAKAMLYDTETGETLLESAPYPAEVNHPDGTQDAEAIFDLTVQAARKVCHGAKADIVALVTAWHSVMLCDAQCRPVTRLYSWASTHASDICATMRRDADFVHHYYQKTGCMVNAMYPFFKLLYLRGQGYDLRGTRIMGQGSYNTFRLTGQIAASDCMISGSGMMNLVERRYDAELLAQLGISEDALCRIVHYDETLPLNDEGACLLDLDPGTPVIAACADGGMNQIAIGGYRRGIMSFSVGTSAAIRLTVDAPRLPEHPSTWCYLSPTSYLSGAATSGACNCVSWFKDNYLPNVGYDELEKDYRFDRNTPTFLPFPFGERCPGWEGLRRGGFVHLSAEHTPADCYQSIYEGVLFNAYQCYLKLRELNASDPTIVLSGGILNSPAWTQMCADIFDHEMQIPENPQSSLWGGVVLAVQKCCGDDAADALIGSFRVVRPDAARHAVYMEKYRRYLDAYDRTAAQQ